MESDWVWAILGDTVQFITPHDCDTLRQNTSALMGDPDPYPQVYGLTKLKPRFMWIIQHRWLRLAPGTIQVPVLDLGHASTHEYLQVSTAQIYLTCGFKWSWKALHYDMTTSDISEGRDDMYIIVFQPLALVSENLHNLISRYSTGQVTPRTEHWCCLGTFIWKWMSHLQNCQPTMRKGVFNISWCCCISGYEMNYWICRLVHTGDGQEIFCHQSQWMSTCSHGGPIL